MAGHIGEGPDLSTANPWKVAQWNPFQEGSNAEITTVIQLAQSLGMWLVAMAANNSASYGGGSAGGKSFNDTIYQNNLDRMLGIPAFTNNVRCTANPNGFILNYMGDEPFLETTWGNPSTFTIAKFNQAARHHKDRWPGCLTFGRVNPFRLRNGGNGWPTGTYSESTWDALDYGWLQYEAPYYKGYQNQPRMTFLQALAFERNYASLVNVGVATSVNFMNVGPKSGTFDGFNSCWHTDNNPSGPTGVVIGPGGTPNAGLSEGDVVPCASTGTLINSTNILTPPAYLALIAQRAATDPDIPFLVYWSEPEGVGEAALLLNGKGGGTEVFWSRSDYDTNRRQAQLNGEARTTFNGFRTAKP
jgi:hypothetical protein